MKSAILLILVVAIAGCLSAPSPNPDPYVFFKSDLYPYHYDPLYRHHLANPYRYYDGYTGYKDMWYPRSVIPTPYFEPAAGRYVYPGLAISKDKEVVEEKKEVIEEIKEMSKDE